MPPPAVVDSSTKEIFGSKIPNRNNHKLVISTLKPLQIDHSNGEESDSDSDNISVPPAIMDIAKVKILGSNVTNRATLPGVGDKPIELIGYENNFITANMKFEKKPLRQTMSTASSTSTSSNDSYNLNTDNPNLWIGSSTSSESESEDSSKEIEEKQKEDEDEIREGLENFHIVKNNNSVKNSELKIMNTLDNVDNLSLQTSKMNINFSINDEKNFIGKERKLSEKFSVKNYEKYLNESEDSESSDDEAHIASENKVWITRGKWTKNNSTESTSNAKNITTNPYGQQKPVAKICAMNGIGFATDFGKTPNNQTTINLPSESWHSSGTGQCQNIWNYSMINQDQIAYSSPTRSEYTNMQYSRPASNYSPIPSHNSPHDSEGYHSLSNGDFDESSRRSSPTYTNFRSPINPFENFENLGESKNIENPYFISKMNSNNMTSNIVASGPKSQANFEFENIPIDNEKIISGMDSPLSSASLVQLNLPPNNVSQTNSMKMRENWHDLEQTKIVDWVLELDELGKEMNSNGANSTVSSNKNMLSQAQCSACILKTPELNQLNSDNSNAIRIPPTITAARNQENNNSTTLRIHGSSNTRGLVTVNKVDDYERDIEKILVYLKSGRDQEETLNGIQAPTIGANYHVDEQKCNFRRNIVGLDRLSPYNKLEQETFEDPKESNTLIPVPVDERSQLVVDKTLKKIPDWFILDLPDTSACQRLKEKLDFNLVKEFLLSYIQRGEKYFGPDKKTGNTFLMAIVRNPRDLQNNIHCLIPMVMRMLRHSKFLMMKNNQGHDALYLAAINCPEFPDVTGYLAATIEKFRKTCDLKLNTYNQNNDTLMHVVAAQGDSHLAVMTELLAVRKERGCSLFDPSAQNNDGKTPLHLAVEANSSNTSKQSLQMVKLLMKHGADICVRDYKGNTALHTAIAHARSKSIVQLTQELLHLGSDCAAVKIGNNKGNLPIHLAASCLNSSSLETQANVCRYLVDNKSPTNVPNYDNEMPLALVARERRIIIENIFCKKY